MSQAEAPPREVGSAGEHPGCRGGRSEQRGEGRPGAAAKGRQAPPRVRRGGRRGGRVWAQHWLGTRCAWFTAPGQGTLADPWSRGRHCLLFAETRLGRRTWAWGDPRPRRSALIPKHFGAS